MTQVRLENIEKSFGTTRVIKGVSLDIVAGEFMVFVGPSGCGKSTMLRLIAGLEQVSGGAIHFDGEPVHHLSPSNRKIAMVFQSYALYPHMTVYDNIAFGLKLAGGGKEKVKEQVAKVARMLQIEQLLERLPKQLSGGQRQRVAIGRAIIREPRVFLFDEPLSNLDAALRVATRLEIAKLHHSMKGTTMVYVTHDQVEAMTLADRICVLRDGVVEQVGTPAELYESPQTLFVARFIGSPTMNTLAGAHADKHGAATVGIRPEDLEVADGAGADFEGSIIHIENIGSDVFVYADIGAGEPLLVRRDKMVPQKLGDAVKVKMREGAKVHRFDKDGRAQDSAV